MSRYLSQRAARHALALAFMALGASMSLTTPTSPAYAQRVASPSGHATDAATGSPDSAPRLPSLGDSVSGDMDLSAERRLGDAAMREIRLDPDVIDDPLLFGYVQSIWQPLLRTARQRGDIDADTERAFAWEPFLIRDRAVNAFALPGGYIGVYLGLVAMTSTRDELAAVLAHEMAHVTQRHIARSITQSSRQTLLSAAAMLAAVLAASKSNNANVAQAAIVGGQALAIQGRLNYSRDMEREADRVGFGIFVGASFAPGGVASMFEKLDNANRLNDSGGYPYLRTHPLTVERIGDARARVDAGPKAKAAASDVEHELMRARARALMDPRTASQRQLMQSAQAVAEGRSATASQDSERQLERMGAHYAAAVAAIAQREPELATRAVQLAEKELRAFPTSMREAATASQAKLVLQITAAQAVAQSGQAARAITMLDDASAQIAGATSAAGSADNSDRQPTRSLMLTRAEFASQWARSTTAPVSPGQTPANLPSANGPRPTVVRESDEALQAWLATHRQDASAWLALARLSEATQQPLRAIRAQAEAHAAMGDVRGALDRMRSAQRMVRESPQGAHDPYESAIVEARVRELLALHRHLFPEARTRP